MSERPPFILPIILTSMICCISLWFSGNAVLTDLHHAISLPCSSAGIIASAVHLGFIAGTLISAYCSISDRFPARTVYFVCAMAGAISNGLILFTDNLISLLSLRFITGILLAGIYPVGMKIAFSWYQKDIGEALGFILGAFAIGTGLPHLLRTIDAYPDWRVTLGAVSLLTVAGGILMFVFVPDSPYLHQRTTFASRAIVQMLKKSPNIRAAAVGYFGHMWELYSIWAFMPYYLLAFVNKNDGLVINISLWTFLFISVGCLGCVLGGRLSGKVGNAKVAFFQLALSAFCCLISPLLLIANVPIFVLVVFLGIWGMAVIGDSPQLSAIVAMNADEKFVGTALTYMNCIGFLISILSLVLASYLYQKAGICYVLLWLAPGPLFGLIGLSSLVYSKNL